MEKTCNSLMCDVLRGDKYIGYMEGVILTQWFIKNKYQFKGSFSRFMTFDHEDNHAGVIVDIILKDKNLRVKNARIEC